MIRGLISSFKPMIKLKISFKNFKYILLAIFVLGAVLLTAFFVITNAKKEVASKNISKDLMQELEKQEDLMIKDANGGNTPQETLALFFDALEKEDLIKASQYYALEKQAKMLAYYQSIKEQGQWPELLKEVEKIKISNQEWRQENDNLYYLLVPAGDGLEKETIFSFKKPVSILERNKIKIITSIWKIY